MHGTRKPLHFTSRLEMETRPKFDHNCLITADNYDHLVANYVLPPVDRVRCRVLRVHKPCSKVHGLGFLAVTKQGTEGYIGNRCKAARGWGEGSTFAHDSARLLLQIEIDDLLSRHAAANSDAGIQTRIAQSCATYEALSADVSALRSRLPAPVFLRLVDLVKRGQSAVTVLVAYQDPPERPGKPLPRPRWVEHQVGVIRAPDALTDGLNALKGRLKSIRVALSAQLDSDTPRKALQKLMREIDGLSDVERELERRVSGFKQFRDPSNIAQCALLARSHEDQRTVLAIAHGSKSASEQARKELYAEISDLLEGRDFKVP
jgi:hypothetical protein